MAIGHVTRCEGKKKKNEKELGKEERKNEERLHKFFVVVVGLRKLKFKFRKKHNCHFNRRYVMMIFLNLHQS
jgi:hypothetical protein